MLTPNPKIVWTALAVYAGGQFIVTLRIKGIPATAVPQDKMAITATSTAPSDTAPYLPPIAETVLQRWIPRPVPEKPGMEQRDT